MKNIYLVTTEGDCEGRSTKTLAYVQADSPQHAVKFLKSVGINEYYQYSVTLVNNPIIEATKTEQQLENYVVEERGSYSKNNSCWVVKEKKEVIENKKNHLQTLMEEHNMTKEEVIKMLNLLK